MEPLGAINIGKCSCCGYRVAFRLVTNVASLQDVGLTMYRHGNTVHFPSYELQMVTGKQVILSQRFRAFRSRSRKLPGQ
jgi:hypothetical protein